MSWESHDVLNGVFVSVKEFESLLLDKRELCWIALRSLVKREGETPRPRQIKERWLQLIGGWLAAGFDQQGYPRCASILRRLKVPRDPATGRSPHFSWRAYEALL
jgi:hypothetical protein